MIFNQNVHTETGLFIANLLATILSIIGSVWMSYSCFKTRPPRSDTLKLILFIALSDVLYAVANLISNTSLEENVIVCNMEGFLREFFLVMSVCLAASMAALCYQKSIQNRRGSFLLLQLREPSNFTFYSIIVSGCICLVLSAIPLIFRDLVIYKMTNVHCYVDAANVQSSKMERIWLLLVFEGVPLLMGCIFTFAVYYLALKKAKQSLGLLIRAQGFNSYKLLWYPTLLFCVYVPSLIDNIMTIFNPDTKLLIEILHVLITHSIGFFNAVFYGLQEKSLAQHNQDEVS